VNVRDQEGNLPLHLMNLGVRGLNQDDTEKMHNVAECLKIYLAAEPYASPDFLAALQDLPEWLQDTAVVSPHVRHILNKKIIQRFPTSILMLDGAMLMAMIVSFELASTRFIDELACQEPDKDTSVPLIVLFISAAYFFVREAIQVVASLTLGAFSSWLYDTTNWLDVMVITLVTYYSVIMAIGTPVIVRDSVDPCAMGEIDPYQAFRTGTAFTKGVLWTAVIYFLKSTRVDFAVFLNGVFYVCKRLVAFLLAVLVILLMFAQMFWIIYLDLDVCTVCRNTTKTADEALVCEECSYPHCEFGESFLKVSRDYSF
jgi:hypothetical protein